MRTILIDFKDGFAVGKETLKGKTGSDLTIVSAYTGENMWQKLYYTVDRTFWTPMTDSKYVKYSFITKKTHPEYFL